MTSPFFGTTDASTTDSKLQPAIALRSVAAVTSGVGIFRTVPSRSADASESLVKELLLSMSRYRPRRIGDRLGISALPRPGNENRRQFLLELFTRAAAAASGG